MWAVLVRKTLHCIIPLPWHALNTAVETGSPNGNRGLPAHSTIVAKKSIGDANALQEASAHLGQLAWPGIPTPRMLMLLHLDW
mmetsp:Transcript_148305/g.258740  ORF Transcript_148305/g.258740 Transcript_148305/m.258740 type:complete len:83 (-) Transcript_148305:38-286(-)